jgi:hypothetical protein
MPSTVERRETDGATPRSVYAPPPRPPRRQRSSDNGGYWAGVAMLLGLLVVVLGFVAVWMGSSAHDARKAVNKAAKAVATGGSSGPSSTARGSMRT